MMEGSESGSVSLTNGSRSTNRSGSGWTKKFTHPSPEHCFLLSFIGLSPSAEPMAPPPFPLSKFSSVTCLSTLPGGGGGGEWTRITYDGKKARYSFLHLLNCYMRCKCQSLFPFRPHLIVLRMPGFTPNVLSGII
jgi:hypothetical protein